MFLVVVNVNSFQDFPFVIMWFECEDFCSVEIKGVVGLFGVSDAACVVCGVVEFVIRFFGEKGNISFFFFKSYCCCFACFSYVHFGAVFLAWDHIDCSLLLDIWNGGALVVEEVLYSCGGFEDGIDLKFLH